MGKRASSADRARVLGLLIVRHFADLADTLRQFDSLLLDELPAGPAIQTGTLSADRQEPERAGIFEQRK